MNREITITRTQSVNYITTEGKIQPTGQRVENTYTQDWDTFCNVWGNINNWKELDKNGKLQHTMFLVEHVIKREMIVIQCIVPCLFLILITRKVTN